MKFDLLEQNIKELDDMETFIREKVFTNKEFTKEIIDNYKQYIEFAEKPQSECCGRENEKVFANYKYKFTTFNSDYSLIYKPYVSKNKDSEGKDNYKDDLDYGDFEYRHVSNDVVSNVDIKFAATAAKNPEQYCASAKLNNVKSFKGNWDWCFNAFNTKVTFIYVPFLRFLLNNNYIEGKNKYTDKNDHITSNEYMAAFAKYEAEGNSLEGLVRIVEKDK